MTHLVVAADLRTDGPGARIASAFHALAVDETETRLDRVTAIDLGEGPALGRFRSALGLGWHARERLKRVERKSGRPVDAVVEVGGAPFRHLMGLGRTGLPTARWTFLRPDHRGPVGAERHVGEEGVHLFFAHLDAMPPLRDLAPTWLPHACPDEVVTTPGRKGDQVVLVAPERKPPALDGIVRRAPKAPVEARMRAYEGASLLVHLDASRLVTSRFVEALGSGRPLLTSPVGDGFDRLFEVNRHALWCDAEDARNAITRFAGSAHADRIGAQAQDRVRAGHLFRHRALTVLDRLLGSH